MNNLKVVGFFVLLFLSLQGKAQYFYRQTLDSNTVLIGDQIHLTIQSSNKPKDPDPIIELKKLSWFEIIDPGQWNLTPSQIYERKIKFSVFDSGTYTIPILSVNLDSHKILTNPIMIRVDLPVDTTGSLLAIKDIILTDSGSNFILYMIIACIGLGLLGFLFYFLLRADKIRPKSLHYVSASLPYETALQKLTELESKKLWQSGKIKEYYDELLSILRNFLQDGFHIPALEMTSTDIKYSILDSKIRWEKKEEFIQCLQFGDLIKFANKTAQAEDHLNWMTVAKSFISNNKENSNEFLRANKKDYIAILGQEYAHQFSRPGDLVPDELIQLKSSNEMKTLVLFSSLTQFHRFELPEGWVNLHSMKVGQLSEWHNNLIYGTPGFKGKLIFILLFPLVAIFLPVFYIVGLLRQENIFSRGVFILDQNGKLLVDEKKITS